MTNTFLTKIKYNNIFHEFISICVAEFTTRLGYLESDHTTYGHVSITLQHGQCSKLILEKQYISEKLNMSVILSPFSLYV